MCLPSATTGVQTPICLQWMDRNASAAWAKSSSSVNAWRPTGTLAILEASGIPEPDVVHEVLEVILPNYEAGRVAVTAVKDHLADVLKIQRAMKAESRSNKWRLEQAVKTQFWVLASNGVTGQSAFKSPDRVYLPTPELKAYFDGNPDAWFVHPYPTTSWPSLFRLALPNRCESVPTD